MQLPSHVRDLFPNNVNKVASICFRMMALSDFIRLHHIKFLGALEWLRTLAVGESGIVLVTG